MPAATCKTDLLAVTEKEWGKLQLLLEKLPETLRCQRDADDTSVKDVLAHRAHWSGLFFQWLDEGRGGKAVAMPDHGVKWNQLKPYNAALRAKYEMLAWEAVCTWLTEAHEKLVAYVRSSDDESLYGDPMPGGTGWTIGRYAEAAGPSHYRSAIKYIRKRIREA